QLVARLRGSLPWPLTGAQERVWDEIRRDMAAPFPMHRLLQGDVGSGKTIVAALAVLTAVEAGFQAAVMAPTAVHVEQPFFVLRPGMTSSHATLVRTTPPNPRMLHHTLDVDLDVSFPDELPPGRRPVVTVARTESKRREIYTFLRDEIGRGRQAYVVYPLVEESEALDLKAATDMARHLAEDVFPDLHVGLMHGRLGFEEKDAVMRRF